MRMLKESYTKKYVCTEDTDKLYNDVVTVVLLYAKVEISQVRRPLE